MTKTTITLLITIYSLARLVTLGAFYCEGTMRLPLSVTVITGICCVLSLIIAGMCYFKQLSGKNLRLALFIGAAAATANMLVILVAQPGTLTNSELLVTGTVFDLLFFMGSCTIKIRDTKGAHGRSPFSRLLENHKSS